MTQAEEKNIFNQSIAPVMDRIRKQNLSMDMYFVATVSELKKKNIAIDNNIVNMMMDKMARDSMPKGTWDYLKGKVNDESLLKSISDWMHPVFADSAFTKEIKRRAELMYKASATEKTIASIATTGVDALTTAPVAYCCPQSVVYGLIIQGGYDIANDKILLPESKEERKANANDAMQKINALDEKTNWRIIPGWMYTKNGITDIKKAGEKKLGTARDWARTNAKWWHDEYEKLSREHKEQVLVGDKTFSRNDCLVKYNQYDKFREVCQGELTARYIAKEKAQEQQRQEALADNASDDLDENTNQGQADNALNAESSQKTDYWGQLLNVLGFNGLGNVGKHLGLTLATLPDMIFGVFTGKTKSVGMNKNTLIPLASLAAGHFIKNPMLKAALMGYGGLNLLNKVGNEAIAQQQGNANTDSKELQNANIKYKQYADETLNPRIGNLHIEGNQLLADIDKVPCSILLPETTVKAYQSGALPLNTLANAVLAKSDLMAQQSEQASIAYSNMQQQEKTRGIR